MKDIKFRAWYNDIRMFKYYDFLYTAQVERFGDDHWDLEYLQQYTGIKDSNNKDIYEGDLLMWDKCKGCNFEVFWHNEECRFKVKTHWQGSICGGYVPEFSAGKDFEVIGNIDENPELL